MEGTVHIRIDDRLIHGQVAARWSTSLRVNRIMVIDDQVAVNETEKTVLRMAAPIGINTSILTVEKATANLKVDRYTGQKVLLIVRRPKVLRQLLDAGLHFDSVNMGNMSNRPGTTQYKRSVSMTPDELADVRYLLAHGVTMTSRMVPEDPPSKIEQYIPAE